MASLAKRLQSGKNRGVVGWWHGARSAQPIIKFVIRKIEKRGKHVEFVTIKARKMQRGKGAEDCIGFLEAAVGGAKFELLAAGIGWGLFHPRRYSARQRLMPAPVCLLVYKQS